MEQLICHRIKFSGIGSPESGGTTAEGELELEALRKWVSSLSAEDLVRAMSFSFEMDNVGSKQGKKNGQSCHEFDLLREMVQTQCPPPVPVHSRAITYKPATSKGATDGRNEQVRQRSVRFLEPRLFQLLARAATTTTTTTRKAAHNKWDVIYKKFTSPWGESWTIGSTTSQQIADEQIIKCTRIWSSSDSSSYSNSCSFHYCNTQKIKDAAHHVLELLRLSSRGHFLSRSYNARKCPSFCAPWFLPQDEWFSLPRYLSSRYEVAIWDSFHRSTCYYNYLKQRPHNKCSSHATSSSSSSSSSSSLFEHALSTWSHDTIQFCLFRAMKITLCQHILQCGDYDATKFTMRDSMLFNLLNHVRGKEELCNALSTPLLLLESLYTIPLIELGSELDTFRLLFLRQFNLVLAQAAETQLLDSLNTTPSSFSTRTNDNTGNRYNNKHQKNSAKKKEKKKKMAEKSFFNGNINITTEAAGAATTSTTTTTASKVHDGSDDDLVVSLLLLSNEDDSSSSEGDFLCLSPSSVRKKHNFATSSVALSATSTTLSKERTRSTILALTVIDSIIEVVFQQFDGLQDKSVQRTPVTNNVDNTMMACNQQVSNEHSTNGISARMVNSVDEIYDVKPTCFISSNAIPNNDDGLTILKMQLEHNYNIEKATKKHVKHHADDDQDVTLLASSSYHLPSYLDPIYEPHVAKVEYFSNSATGGGEGGVGVSLDLSGSFDGWKSLKPVVVLRDRSVFAEFFERHQTDDYRPAIASSTAASVASSVSEPDVDVINEAPSSRMTDFDFFQIPQDETMITISQGFQESIAIMHTKEELAAEKKSLNECQLDLSKATSSSLLIRTKCIENEIHDTQSFSIDVKEAILSSFSLKLTMGADSLSKDEDNIIPPPSPATPPQLSSPIQLSLADLGKLRLSPKSATSLIKPTLIKSWSRENLQQNILRVDSDDPLRLVREFANSNVSMVPPPSAAATAAKVNKQHQNLNNNGIAAHHTSSTQSTKIRRRPGDCAVSESGMEENNNLDWCNEGLTSLSSPPGHVGNEAMGSVSCRHLNLRDHAEDESVLREERNAYRDLALTLGAEVSKLRNLLAAEQCCHFSPVLPYGATPISPFSHVVVCPEYMPPFFNDRITMSDAGQTRGDFLSDAGQTRGDYESIVSEDGNDIVPHHLDAGRQWVQQHHCDAGAESDVSIEFAPHKSQRSCDIWKLPTGNFPTRALQSRLSNDIDVFLQTVSSNLIQTEDKRKAATARFERMVRKLWPRAQVKMYGSHISNLCLPSSDLDFVICLPAVHKAFLPSKPGVLEGRNAINETCQKLLARTLKGESWIDPRSIKVIERTTVPVIKVSTKDVRAKVLQLDISFDGPGHHGLDAINMVNAILEEFPKVRPLTLVLKQFLLDRGLLTAYTGGLSSYCLLLMVTRYLQEQSSSWTDCGSLLLGFLDFYGNSFDPGATGISVRRRSYFPRQGQPRTAEQMWSLAQLNLSPSSNSMQLPLTSNINGNNSKNTSTAEISEDDCCQSSNSHMSSVVTTKPPRAYSRSGSVHVFLPPAQNQTTPNIQTSLVAPPSRRPCTFDPLFVEDPLNPHNNVGRNAFRVFQIKRAFADAHRALVASLDWDICSGDVEQGCLFPLLKCLLKNDDIFRDLD